MTVADWKARAETSDPATRQMLMEAIRLAETGLAPEEYVDDALRWRSPSGDRRDLHGVADLVLTWAAVLSDDEDAGELAEADRLVELVRAAGFEREGKRSIVEVDR